jgi:ABC-type cobalamin/Fe3+-siderophores transport system ATPase subunit
MTNAGVVVLHDLELAARFCDRLYLCSSMVKIYASGSPSRRADTREPARGIRDRNAALRCSENGVNVTLVRRICEGHP